MSDQKPHVSGWVALQLQTAPARRARRRGTTETATARRARRREGKTAKTATRNAKISPVRSVRLQPYDALGRLTSETNELGTFTYDYDGVTSRLEGVISPNGQTSSYSYFGNSGDRRLQTIHHQTSVPATLSKFDYTYSADGNIATWRQQAGTDAVMWEYGHDAAEHLTRAVKKSTDPTPAILKRYAYDPAGNRTVEQIDDTVVGASYNNVTNKTYEVDNTGSTNTLTYDANGNLTADGATVTRRAFTLGEQAAGVARFFATDHLGSIGEVTNGASTVLARYAYDAWGRRSLRTGTDVTTVGYTGHQWQATGGLWLTQFRGYDAKLGRWASEDPYRDTQVATPEAPLPGDSFAALVDDAPRFEGLRVFQTIR